jgi:adenylate kinase
MEERLNREDVDEGFILDGFPRSLSQVGALNRILTNKGVELDYVLYVEIDDEILINRLSKRRICIDCGEIFHLEYDPPDVAGICDKCGNVLVQREDDHADVIKRRLKIYREETEPLLSLYMKRGIVEKISGDLPHEEIPKALSKLFVG